MNNLILRKWLTVIVAAAALVWHAVAMGDSPPVFVADEARSGIRIEVRHGLANQDFIQPVGLRTLRMHQFSGAGVVHIEVSQRGSALLLSTWRTARGPTDADRRLWLREYRVVIPVAEMLSSWDVKALQRELERLGVIKTRPSPVVDPQAPAPRPQIQEGV